MNTTEGWEARTLLDELPVLAWTARRDGALDHVNQRWCQYTGLSAAESLGSGWTAVLHPEDQATVLARWVDALQDGSPVELELRLRRADGEYRWHLARARALRDDAGQVVGWCGTSTDIEARRRADQAVRDSERAARLVVNTIPGHVLTNTPEGALEFANRQFLAYTGRSIEELRAWRSTDLIHPEDLPRVTTEWEHHLQVGEPCEMDVRVRGADGLYRWFHYWARPQRDAQGRIVRWYVLATDVDELRQVQESLRATQGRLAQAARLAAVSELSASIAHEINQPLAAIVANHHASRRWLAAEVPNVERALMSIDLVIRDVQAAMDVLQRMRSLFSQGEPARERLDVNAVVRQALELTSGELRRPGIVWQTRLAAGLPVMHADPVQIQQVLANLVRNGVEAMEGEGATGGLLCIRTLRGNGEVLVTVEDNGPGIDPNAVDLLFESFYTTKDGGMGMGLAICRTIVEAHGGRMWVAANQPRGSIVGFALPAA